ncbi:hypothetical protein [Streptomyces sp. H27-C3]|uniref:hypothetical protein n=1 Tax=Streptomyces sp. H27-C3 TaxID=3046305 RepID=UPI0032D90646
MAGSLIMLSVGRGLTGPVAERVGVREVVFAGVVMKVLVCVALLSVRAIRGLKRIG